MATKRFAESSPYEKYKKFKQTHHPTDYKYTEYQQNAGLVPRNTDAIPSHLRVINIAIIGLGRAGSIHQVNAMKNPRIKVLYIVDENRGRLKQVKAEWNLNDNTLKHSSEIDQIIKDPSLHAVVICTPTFTHEDLIKKALKAKKAVFCEKPIGETEEDTRRCYDMAEKENLLLFCAFNRRFDPSFRQLKDRAHSGVVGQIHRIKTVARDCPLPSIEYLKHSGGIFHDCVVHDIDLICWILGEYPTEVFASGSAFIPEIKAIRDHDTVAAVLNFASGTIGTIDISRNAIYGYDQQLEIFGPKGRIHAKNESPYPLLQETENGLTEVPIHYSFPSRYNRAYINEMDEFLDIIQGLKRNILTGDNTIRVSKIASALEKSVTEGKLITVKY